MADVQELLDALRDDFRKRCENDRKLKKIADTLEHGTYVDAHDYAVRVGEILSESFAEVLTRDVYPDLTEEMARQLIPSLLGSGHRMTSNACVSVQTNLNRNAGLGLKPIEPEFDVGRAYDLADKYVGYDEWKDARWVLGEPVENFMQSVPDDAIRRNADFQWRSGMSPKIIRKAEPGACKWCRALAGTYDYKDVRDTGNDVYRRHENCRCIVTYDPGDGKKQDVWSKAEWIGDDADVRRKAIEGIEERRKERERALIENRIKKSEVVNSVQKELGYSTRGASMWYNAHKEDIERYGIDYMLELEKLHSVRLSGGGSFDNPTVLDNHFEKHKNEFEDGITKEDYLRRANEMADRPLSETVEELKRSDNSISKYDIETNEFVVINEDGSIRSYFRPTNGIEYWKEEHERNS